MQKRSLVLKDPVVVAQAGPELKGWGPYQFPFIERLADGALHVTYHLHADSATAYGLSQGHALSRDEGRSWQPIGDPPTTGGLLLPNGDRVLAAADRSTPVAQLSLPEPIASTHATYVDYDYYAAESLPPALARAWPLLRCPKGSNEWQREWATVKFEKAADVRAVTEKVFVVPFFEHNRMHVASDGSLRATLYAMPQLARRNHVLRTFLTVLVSSRDEGRTWREIGTIPYAPEIAADPLWDHRDGFSEPQVGEMPDGSLLMLLRTDDGNGPGPMYSARSEDGGTTWGRPRLFDARGVWPQIVALQCGVTLATYGRPGLFVRATSDPKGLAWDERLVLMPDAPSNDPNTCSYSGLIALDERRAMVIYSDSRFPNAQGQLCKTILSREIEVTR